MRLRPRSLRLSCAVLRALLERRADHRGQTLLGAGEHGTRHDVHVLGDDVRARAETAEPVAAPVPFHGRADGRHDTRLQLQRVPDDMPQRAGAGRVRVHAALLSVPGCVFVTFYDTRGSRSICRFSRKQGDAATSARSRGTTTVTATRKFQNRSRFRLERSNLWEDTLFFGSTQNIVHSSCTTPTLRSPELSVRYTGYSTIFLIRREGFRPLVRFRTVASATKFDVPTFFDAGFHYRFLCPQIDFHSSLLGCV